MKNTGLEIDHICFDTMINDCVDVNSVNSKQFYYYYVYILLGGVACFDDYRALSTKYSILKSGERFIVA